MKRFTVTLIAAVALALAGCGGGEPERRDVEVEPVSAVDVDALNDAVAAVHCEDFYEWSNDVAGGIASAQVVDSYLRVNKIADDAAGSAVGREIREVVDTIDDYTSGRADSYDVNRVTGELLAAYHAVGWTSQQ